MSAWIQVTNLPRNYCEKDAHVMFDEIGALRQVFIDTATPLTSTLLVRFFNTRSARSAACRKDQTTFAGTVVRVRVVWSSKENLTTIKVSNLPLTATEQELHEYFLPFGDIIDVRFDEMGPCLSQSHETQMHKNEQIRNTKVGFVSFGRVDYALRACHEMNHSIITGLSDGSGLSVCLANPDSRNLKWKRNPVEFVRCFIPSKRLKTINNRVFKDNVVNSANASLLKQNHFLPTIEPPVVVNNNHTVMRNVHYSLTNGLGTRDKNVIDSQRSWPLSTHHGKTGVHENVTSVCNGSTFAPIYGNGPPSNNVAGVISCSANINAVNTFPIVSQFENGLKGMDDRKPTQQMSNVPLQRYPPMESYDVQNNNVSSNVMLNYKLQSPCETIVNSLNASKFCHGLVPITQFANGCIAPLYKYPVIPIPQVRTNSSFVNPLSSTLQQFHVQIPNVNHSASASSVDSLSLASSAGSSVISDTKVIVADAEKSTCLQNKLSTESVDGGSNDSSLLYGSVWSAKQREIGDIIYYEVKTKYPERAAKVTGMLLSLPQNEIDLLLLDKQKLMTRVNQFIRLLDSHNVL